MYHVFTYECLDTMYHMYHMMFESTINKNQRESRLSFLTLSLYSSTMISERGFFLSSFTSRLKLVWSRAHIARSDFCLSLSSSDLLLLCRTLSINYVVMYHLPIAATYFYHYYYLLLLLLLSINQHLHLFSLSLPPVSLSAIVD